MVDGKRATIYGFQTTHCSILLLARVSADNASIFNIQGLGGISWLRQTQVGKNNMAVISVKWPNRANLRRNRLIDKGQAGSTLVKQGER